MGRTSDETEVSQPTFPETQTVTAYRLRIVEGPDRGKHFDLDGNLTRVLAGTGPACDLKLTDPEVSRRHATFDGNDRPLRVTDMGSTNGTLVNGVKILDAHLFGGETIRLGQTVLQLDVLEASRTVPMPAAGGFGKTIGGSVEMRRIYPLCERLAATSVPVIIEGETGTGKEVLAESLHEAGPRAQGPFMVFDCTAVPPNLVESELFGHERGSFTGAVGTRRGIFEQAHGGTLLIDEIGDLEGPLQPKLLRAIQRGEIRRVGGDKTIAVDVRIIAATRRDLDREVQAGRFRDDLFFRLAVGRIELPPLRRRHGDVELLAQSFWTELGSPHERELPYALLRKWEGYEWPGNVRELRNEVARRAALGDLADLRPLVDEGVDLPFARAKEVAIADFERRYVAALVERHGGNVSKAARASGLALRYFQLLRAKHAK